MAGQMHAYACSSLGREALRPTCFAEREADTSQRLTLFSWQLRCHTVTGQAIGGLSQLWCFDLRGCGRLGRWLWIVLHAVACLSESLVSACCPLSNLQPLLLICMPSRSVIVLPTTCSELGCNPLYCPAGCSLYRYRNAGCTLNSHNCNVQCSHHTGTTMLHRSHDTPSCPSHADASLFP